MLFKNLLAASSLAATAIAAPAPQAGHAHNQHKRNLVVVTETETVIVTASVAQVVAGASTTYTFSTLPTSEAAASSQSTTIQMQAPVAGSSTVAAVLSSAETTSAADETSTTTTASSTKETSSTSTSTSSSSTATSSSSSSFTGGSKGISYSPYTSSGDCKSLSEVESDLAQISDYEVIRLYGVDCSQVENVLQAKADGQKLFLGIYYMDAIEDGVSTIADAIESYGSWDDVYTVSIGNELVNDGEATVDQVSSYLDTGRSALTSAGYSGPVVSVDTHIATINNPDLCELSDYVAINAHAYFDYNTVAEDAGSWLLLQIERVWSACGGDKTVFVTESGWPHKGDTYGVAVADQDSHDAAISSLKSTVGESVILFNAFDDLWKSPGSQNCEQYWGIISS